MRLCIHALVCTSNWWATADADNKSRQLRAHGQNRNVSNIPCLKQGVGQNREVSKISCLKQGVGQNREVSKTKIPCFK